MFETSGDKSIEEFIKLMTQFKRVFDISRAYYKFDYKIERTFRVSASSDYQLGDMVAVKPWKREVQPNLPAICIIISIDKNKQGLYIYKGEYLDEPRGSNDTFRLSKSQIILLSPKPTDKLINIINKHLIRLKRDGLNGIFNGKPCHEMSHTAERTILREQNDAVVEKIIENYSDSDKSYTIEKIKIEIPSIVLIDILKYELKINDSMIEILKSKCNISKKHVIDAHTTDFRERPSNQLPILKFNNSYKGIKSQIVITDDECIDIVKKFKEDIQYTPEQQLVASNIITCPICYTSDHRRNFTFIDGCHHILCNDCNAHYDTERDYSHGSIVELRNHRCHICNKVNCDKPEINAIFEKYKGDIPSNIVVRYCIECNDIFEFEKTCGAEDTDIPDKCLAHRNMGCDIKECPSCGAYISLTEGCDHMECICGADWCFGCQYMFSDEIKPILGGIYWSCDGQCSLDTERRYIDDENFQNMY
jgi:hypothetical protein